MGWLIRNVGRLRYGMGDVFVVACLIDFVSVLGSLDHLCGRRLWLYSYRMEK